MKNVSDRVLKIITLVLILSGMLFTMWSLVAQIFHGDLYMSLACITLFTLYMFIFGMWVVYVVTDVPKARNK